ncbi:GNAT family N-acetyltransferase [Rhodanobacter sp. OK091]|uniref:GNAT family N-acetyltransferase n=1 Tax=Rhodanobacter sp. OK091 TaxID=1881037 RepID=UPI000920E1F6|nr:GNAT family N-acetyltransferase [Rhodanobacter sp. OK091]SHM49247.1 Acetyltransferase (GNAT) family protein [Rhodanobacter sp. OK091]
MNSDGDWFIPSPKDSARFGLKIVRGRIDQDSPTPGILHSEIVALGTDIAVLRIPAGMTAPLRDFTNHGLIPIHADTLVYYERQLTSPVAISEPPTNLIVEKATIEDRSSIADVARRGFGSYRSHYHANPLLDPVLILEGYAEWAIDYISSEPSDRETWIVRNRGAVIAFATCSLIVGDEVVEVVLNAVDPAHAGHGVYGHLLRHMLRTYQRRGLRAIRISTQVWNYVVQRAWTREGLAITHAYDTYHINSLFGSKTRDLP